MKKALIAMSGGVDSSVCAYLAMRAGYECIGATMLLHGDGGQDAKDAKRICTYLGIEHHVFDMRQDFRNIVMEDFVSRYEEGATPNPCIMCNRHFKFGRLMDMAKSHGCDTIVTGHYAISDGKGGLFKAKDIKKDQSYVLWSLCADVLKNCFFPLGSLTKAEAREIAEREGLVTARKSDSQDICFVPDGEYASFIESYRNKKYPEGKFLDTKGNVIGTHRGIINYTQGQRKGLGIAFGKPMYVVSKNPETNEVVLGSNDDLFTKEVFLKDFNLIYKDYKETKAKIRYNQTEQSCTLIIEDGLRARLVFDEPQRASAKGQSAVVYDGDRVVGGGIID